MRRLSKVLRKRRSEHVTLETARQMPTAEIDSIAFTPPALREDIAGWGPEQSKAWAGWTMPKYTW